jgi:hypothetical protein
MDTIVEVTLICPEGSDEKTSKSFTFGSERYIRYLLNTNATLERDSFRNFIPLSGFPLTQYSVGYIILLGFNLFLSNK